MKHIHIQIQHFLKTYSKFFLPAQESIHILFPSFSQTNTHTSPKIPKPVFSNSKTNHVPLIPIRTPSLSTGQCSFPRQISYRSRYVFPFSRFPNCFSVAFFFFFLLLLKDFPNVDTTNVINITSISNNRSSPISFSF